MIVRGLALASVLLLGACGGMNGYISATPEDEKVVNAGGYSEAAMAQTIIVQNPDFNGGKISPKALKKIQQYSISCQRQIDPQLAGKGQSAVHGALPNAAGGLATGPAAALAFSGAKLGEYATYGGVASFGLGVPYGMQSGSYSMASAKGSCTRDFWGDIAKTDPDFKGTHVEIVYYAKNWGDSKPPALDRSAIARPPAQ